MVSVLLCKKGTRKTMIWSGNYDEWVKMVKEIAKRISKEKEKEEKK